MNLILSIFFIGGLLGLSFNESCDIAIYAGLPILIFIRAILFYKEGK